MSFNATRWAMSQNNIKDSQEKLLLVALAHFLNESTRQCNPSRETLMKTACISNSNTLTKKIKSLEEKGLISVIAGKGCSNNYLLHEESTFTDEAPSRMKHLHTCSTTTFTREAPPPSYMKHEQRIEQRIEHRNLMSSEQNSDDLQSGRNIETSEEFTLTPPEENESPEQEEAKELTPKQRSIQIGKRCPQEKLVELYHERLPGLPTVRSWNTATRKQNMAARWREMSQRQEFQSEQEGLDFFRSFFDFVGRSPFLMGQVQTNNSNSRPWRADLPWLMKAENFAKVIDRKYHG